TDPGPHRLRSHFDVMIESQAVGLRKPDPRIYQLACRVLGVAPAETAFLDDIGLNLKSARALGMHTIKVDEPDAALRELSALVGFDCSPESPLQPASPRGRMMRAWPTSGDGCRRCDARS